MQFDLLTDEGFSAYLDSIPSELLKSSEGRRALTAMSPLAFALIYLPHHLKGPQTMDKITFSDLHVALIEDGKKWALPTSRPRERRDIYVAPRETGKSTWIFLILPVWSAAHGHDDFIAAFSDSGGQAQLHLASFKKELDTNELLREDFPELCTPARRASGVTEDDSKKLYKAANGFVFAAGGVDTGVLGMKAGHRRPSRILLDDVEPGETQYSDYQCEGRLTTLIDSILALNEFAPVVFTGTVVMPNSIVHQAVKTLDPTLEHEEWISEQNFVVHHFLPIVVDEKTGEERSIWPSKWTLEYLYSIMHTRSYKKNFANDPAGKDGEYWNDEDFVFGELVGCTKTILSIDPFVKDGVKSDPCGLAVLSFLPKKVLGPQNVRPAMCMVEYADDCRKTGSALRKRVLEILEQYEHISMVLIETNQGGDLWKETLHNLPVRLKTVDQSVAKDVRAGRLLNLYQKGRVLHARKFSKAQDQMIAYRGPKSKGHDDIIDAIGTGVLRYLKPVKLGEAKESSDSYL